MRAPGVDAAVLPGPPDVAEEALAIPCGGETLLGVLSLPLSGSSGVGVIVVVGGPQYRAGSHRQFVRLARMLAGRGHAVLRFDSRGMGDSTGALRPFDAITDDIEAAIAAFRSAAPMVHRVVLWGLCDAAAAALLYLHARPAADLAGLVLVNPWVRSSTTLAQTNLKHYYRARLLQADFWRKLLRGGIGASAVQDLWRNARQALTRGTPRDEGQERPFQERMALGLQGFDGAVLLITSERDLTAQEFLDHSAKDPAWQRALGRSQPVRCQIQGADHTCSDPASQRALEETTADWLAEQAAAATAAR